MQIIRSLGNKQLQIIKYLMQTIQSVANNKLHIIKTQSKQKNCRWQAILDEIRGTDNPIC